MNADLPTSWAWSLNLRRRSFPSALTYCDMTTSPDGELVPVEQRLAEIHDRYGSGHLVSRSIQRATPMILRAVEQVHQQSRPDHIAPRDRRQAD